MRRTLKPGGCPVDKGVDVVEDLRWVREHPMTVSIENPSRVVLRVDRGDIPATAALLRGDCAILRSCEISVCVRDHAPVLLA